MKSFVEIAFSIFILSFLSSLSLISTLYHAHLELSREIQIFLCQENLTKLFVILCRFGTAFAR